MKNPFSGFSNLFSHRSSRKGGTVFAFLPWIVFAAFLIRFLVSAELIRADEAVTAPSTITDMRTYLDLADRILRGDWPDVFYYQPFYYGVFLPLCRMFGGGAWVLALVQSLLGAATVWLAGRCAWLTLGRRAAFWSELLCAFCAISIYFTPYALLEVLQGFWITLLFYLTLRAWKDSRTGYWILCGLVLGCSILTRGNTWCFLPVLMLAAWVRRKSWKQCALALSLLIGFAVLTQLPFLLYNSVKLGRLSGPSTAGNAVLAIGNHPEAAPSGLELPYPKTYELWLAEEREISVPRRMWNWFREEPGAFLEQQFEKVLAFWDAADPPNNITEYNANLSWLMRTFHFLPTGIILLLGLAGGLSGFYRRMFFRRKNFLLLWGFIALYAASIIAFYILARFRLPLLGLLSVSGGIYLAQILRRNPFGVWVRLGGLGALAGLVVYGVSPLYAGVYEPLVAAQVRPNGVRVEFAQSPWMWKNPVPGPFLLLADHSSVLKGGWGGIGNRFTAEKTFVLKGKLRGNRALLVLPLFGGAGGVTLTANGERQWVPVGNRVLTAEIPVREEAGKITVRLDLSDPRGDWTCALDARRDYGRTLLDGRKIPYELVAYLVVPVEKRNTEKN